MSTYGRRPKRFDGVVGYRICLTHRRSPVRTRVEPFFYKPKLARTPISGFPHADFCILFSDGQEQHGTSIVYVFFHMMRLRNDLREMDDKLPPVSQNFPLDFSSPSSRDEAKIAYRFAYNPSTEVPTRGAIDMGRAQSSQGRV
jgi:hypothetical protein